MECLVLVRAGLLRGCGVHYAGVTIKVWAVCLVQVVKCLLEAGADVHTRMDKALLLALGAIDNNKWVPCFNGGWAS